MYKDTVSDMIKKFLPLLLIPSSFLSICPSMYIDVFILGAIPISGCVSMIKRLQNSSLTKKLKIFFGCVIGKQTLQRKFNTIVIHAVLLDSKFF